jgi:hypothetical protein
MDILFKVDILLNAAVPHMREDMYYFKWTSL